MRRRWFWPTAVNCCLGLYMAFAVRGVSDDLNSAAVVFLIVGLIAGANLVFVLRRMRPSDRDGNVLFTWFTWTAVVTAAGWAATPLVGVMRAHGTWAGIALAVMALAACTSALADRTSARRRRSTGRQARPAPSAAPARAA